MDRINTAVGEHRGIEFGDLFGVAVKPKARGDARHGASPIKSGVTGGQFGCLPNMIQPPLLGVVKAASAVSARTLTWRGPAVPRSCSMLSVYIAVRQRPVPKLPPLEQNGCGPSTLRSPA